MQLICVPTAMTLELYTAAEKVEQRCWLLAHRTQFVSNNFGNQWGRLFAVISRFDIYCVLYGL
jgi:hypothetical protein